MQIYHRDLLLVYLIACLPIADCLLGEYSPLCGFRFLNPRFEYIWANLGILSPFVMYAVSRQLWKKLRLLHLVELCFGFLMIGLMILANLFNLSGWFDNKYDTIAEFKVDSRQKIIAYLTNYGAMSHFRVRVERQVVLVPGIAEQNTLITYRYPAQGIEMKLIDANHLQCTFMCDRSVKGGQTEIIQ